MAPAPTVFLDEIRIVAPARRSAPKRRQMPPAEPKLVPCSGWRALGPVYSAREGEIPRQRHVRLMCPES